MPSPENHRRAAPLLAGIALLAILVTAGLLPNTGALPASASCPYGNCSTTNTSPVPVWLYAVLALLLVVAGVLAIFLLRRRRSPPSEGPVAAWSGETGASAGPTGPSGPTPEEGVAAGAPAGAAYLEGPEDIGHAPPVPPAPAAAKGEEDIDSLMKELDKISGEILKRGPPGKKPDEPPAASSDDPPAE